jgi:hypothetical protein
MPEFQTDAQDAQPIRDGVQRSIVLKHVPAHIDLQVLTYATIRAGNAVLDVFVESVSFKAFGQIENHDAFDMGLRGRAPSQNGADPGARAADVLADALQRRFGSMAPEQMLTTIQFKYLGG